MHTTGKHSGLNPDRVGLIKFSCVFTSGLNQSNTQLNKFRHTPSFSSRLHFKAGNALLRITRLHGITQHLMEDLWLGTSLPACSMGNPSVYTFPEQTWTCTTSLLCRMRLIRWLPTRSHHNKHATEWRSLEHTSKQGSPQVGKLLSRVFLTYATEHDQIHDEVFLSGAPSWTCNNRNRGLPLNDTFYD